MRSLQNEGVKTIFGYPGGAIMPVFDALYDYTVGDRHAFNHVLVRHEQGAAHAAEGYARVSGEVGVCLVTSGPGATNTGHSAAYIQMELSDKTPRGHCVGCESGVLHSPFGTSRTCGARLPEERAGGNNGVETGQGDVSAQL